MISKNTLNKEELNKDKLVLFSKDETDIINRLINEIHNNNNTIVLSESLYKAIFFRESLRHGFIKELKNKHHIDDIILESFEEKIIQIRKIDKNNIFEFSFLWNNELDIRIDFLEEYEKISISEIAFNKDKTKAIIFLELFKDNGFGRIYHFKKDNNEWKIIDVISLYGIMRGSNKILDEL